MPWITSCYRTNFCPVGRGRHHIRMYFTILPVKDWRRSLSCDCARRHLDACPGNTKLGKRFNIRVWKGATRTRKGEKSRGRGQGERCGREEERRKEKKERLKLKLLNQDKIGQRWQWHSNQWSKLKRENVLNYLKLWQ